MAQLCKRGKELHYPGPRQDRKCMKYHFDECKQCRNACIEVCLGCGVDTNFRDCGCPAGSGLRVVEGW